MNEPYHLTLRTREHKSLWNSSLLFCPLWKNSPRNPGTITLHKPMFTLRHETNVTSARELFTISHTEHFLVSKMWIWFQTQTTHTAPRITCSYSATELHVSDCHLHEPVPVYTDLFIKGHSEYKLRHWAPAFPSSYSEAPYNTSLKQHQLRLSWTCVYTRPSWCPK